MLQRQAAEQKMVRLLSGRELEIVRLAARGLRNKEIAERRSLTEGTVKVHLHHIYQKLEVKGRSELIHVVYEQALEI